ncbi:MAG: hypothetical protein PHP30_07335 [Bacteroidales bacterium]|nr:hypothetical protein [Bacteroidales bacterium]MDD3989888.1 hypothetical protein [Bacteroidales bacterium]MDD4638291.1 hypothetical protein [Bacteroidales bacterium]
MEKVVVNISKTEKGYCANLDIIEGFIVAVSGSFADLKKEVEKSVEFYIDCARKDGEFYPQVFDMQFEYEYKFDIESLLYFYDGIISGVTLSKLTGINEKQLSRYRVGASKPRKEQAIKIVNAFHRIGNDLLSVSL